MKTELLAIPVLLMLFVSPARAQGTDDRLKKRFLSEYPEALKAWEARSSRVEATVKYTEDDTRNKATPHREVLFWYKCKLPDMMLLTSISNDAEGQREESVSASNANYSFALRRNGEGTDFRIKSLEAANGSDRGPRRTTLMLLNTCLWAPYSAPFPNVGLLSQPRFAVRGVSTVDRNGKSLLKVEFDIPYTPPSEERGKTARGSGGIEGFLLVSPEEKWVIYEFEHRNTRGSQRFSRKGTMEYLGTAEGFPIPKRAAYQRWKLPEGELVETSSRDFLEFRFADVPDKEFTLTAFGFPEAVSQPAKVARSSRLGYWLLALALAALAAAVSFKIAASRRRPSLSS